VGLQKKRPVVLTVSDRDELARVTRTGVHPASMIMRARVLHALDTSVGVVDPKEAIRYLSSRMRQVVVTGLVVAVRWAG
jgi:hypothetical protein